MARPKPCQRLAIRIGWRNKFKCFFRPARIVSKTVCGVARVQTRTVTLGSASYRLVFACVLGPCCGRRLELASGRHTLRVAAPHELGLLLALGPLVCWPGRLVNGARSPFGRAWGAPRATICTICSPQLHADSLLMSRAEPVGGTSCAGEAKELGQTDSIGRLLQKVTRFARR